MKWTTKAGKSQLDFTPHYTGGEGCGWSNRPAVFSTRVGSKTVIFADSGVEHNPPCTTDRCKRRKKQ